MTLRNQSRQRTKEAGRQKLSQIGLKPLVLDLEEASAVCGMSAAQFQKEVAAGNLPAPIGGLLSRRKLWGRAALERAINGETDTGSGDPDPLMNEIRARANRLA